MRECRDFAKDLRARGVLHRDIKGFALMASLANVDRNQAVALGYIAGHSSEDLKRKINEPECNDRDIQLKAQTLHELGLREPSFSHEQSTQPLRRCLLLGERFSKLFSRNESVVHE